MAKFKFIETGMHGLMVIEPTVFSDERGCFWETWHQGEFAAEGLHMSFVQDNQSTSKSGVLRGLHFQKENPQGKLVRVISGEVFDVAVDIRKGSTTFGKWYGVMLSAENKKQLYVPEGFAHGFLVTGQTAELAYKCTRPYDSKDEAGIIWNDPAIGIRWPQIGIHPILNEKDSRLPPLQEIVGKE